MFKCIILVPIFLFSVMYNTNVCSENTENNNINDADEDDNNTKEPESTNEEVKSNNKKLKNKDKTKNLKCKNKKCNKDNVDIIIYKQEQLQELNMSLLELKHSKTSIDSKEVDSILDNIKNAHNILDNITHKKYKKKELEMRVKEFNDNMQKITDLYKQLFSFHNKDNNNKMKSTNNHNAKLITSLDWNKDTRNNSNVITNPLAVSDDELNNTKTAEDIINSECIFIDLSKPLTRQHVEEYYEHKVYNETPVHENIPIGKSYDNDNISNKINKTIE